MSLVVRNPVNTREMDRATPQLSNLIIVTLDEHWYNYPVNLLDKRSLHSYVRISHIFIHINTYIPGCPERQLYYGTRVP